VQELVEVPAGSVLQGDVGAVLATVSPDATVMCGTNQEEWWEGHNVA